MIKFSVFLPVRNGWPLVKECVNSILNQTHSNFELHVLDNFSTDATVDWLKEINDSRITIWPAEKSLSIVENWSRIKDIKKCEFMTMIGHDDIFDLEFLEAVTNLIKVYPDAGIYFTGGRLINAEGAKIRSCYPLPEKETATDYLNARLAFRRDISGTGYVMRSSDYDRLGGIPNFEKLFFSDDALWLSLMKDKYIAIDPSELFSVRIHAESESGSLPSVWKPLLKGLCQFHNFLQSYCEKTPNSRSVIIRESPKFMLAYHQNAYIFALIGACQKGEKISLDIIGEIEKSLSVCAPELDIKKLNSTKVRIIKFLNATKLRKLVPLLWKFYCGLRNRT